MEMAIASEHQKVGMAVFHASSHIPYFNEKFRHTQKLSRLFYV